MITYRWRAGARKKGDVNAIGVELSKLSDAHGDRLKAQVVLDAARDPESPLHSAFTWENDIAAEHWRRNEARILMRDVLVVIKDNAPPQPMFISVIETIEDEEDRAYVTTARVFSDAALTRQVLHRAYGEMQSFREKYGHFKELAKVADTVQGEIHSLMEKTEPAVV